jgi:hypothetical protein
VTQPEFVLANKVKFDRDASLALLDGVSTVMVARGKKLLEFKMADADTDELASVILGRSGTLRAPAMRVGDTFVVGFHAEGYEGLFG